MGALSLSHILIAVIVAVAVLAPSRLSSTLKTMRSASEQVKDARSSVKDHVDQLTEMHHQIHDQVNSALADNTLQLPTAVEASQHRESDEA
jgi:Sec-independent protein translocase protein TatA